MKAERPCSDLIPQLRSLWKEAFGDTDAFLDLFFGLAYDPDRCRCIRSQGRVTAALYWLDMYCGDEKNAYIYAVATAGDCRGQGLCRQLMTDTAAVLKEKDYCGALLVPQDEGLRAMYSRMGYRNTAAIDECFCAAGDTALSVQEIPSKEYAARRAGYLPQKSVHPSDAALAFLAALARFYAGDGFAAAVSRESGHLRILEYLGDGRHLPGLIAALGATEATVRMPGNTVPFAMYLPLSPNCTEPSYYPFAFD